MKKAVVLSALLGALSVGHAQVTSNPSGIAPFVGFGLTFGGDQIGRDIQYESGKSSSIHAGGMVDLRAGLEYQAINSLLSFQFSVGYHVDDTLNADNGSVSFSRFPVELLAHYRINDTWRMGGGLRKALNAKANSSGAGSYYVTDQKYSSDLGLVLEAEAFISPRFGVKLRAVSEKYKPELGNQQEVDGSHLGVIGVYYFK